VLVETLGHIESVGKMVPGIQGDTGGYRRIQGDTGG